MLKWQSSVMCAVLISGLGLVLFACPRASAGIFERLQNSIAPSRVSIAAKQAELGTDVHAIFNYVRDKIRIEPYRGVLRGARGTLISEAGSAWTAAAQPASDPSPGPTPVQAQLDRGRGALQLVLDHVDTFQFDVDALQAKLGTDPAALFAFVRDNIRYDPYVGTLRGARGALLARSANALDRSLLLAALLSKASFQVEIVSGTLDPASAARLVDQAATAASLPPAFVPDAHFFEAALAPALGTTPEKVAELAAGISQRADAAEKSVSAVVDAQSAILARQLAAARFPTSDGDVARQIAAAGHHYWVRYHDGSGKVIDLDSAFAGALSGKTYAAPASTFAPTAIPQELFHAIRIVVTLRVAEPGTGSEENLTDIVLIDKTLQTSERQGQLIKVENLPIPSVEQALAESANLQDAVGAVKRYLTVLHIGDEIVGSKFFDLHGTLTDGADDQPSAFGIIGGALDRLAQQRRIVGQWLDVIAASPGLDGQAPSERRIRRDILAPEMVTSWSPDGPAAGVRKAASYSQDQLRRGLLYQLELTPVTGLLHPDYVGYLATDGFLGAIGFAEQVAKRVDGASGQDSITATFRRYPLAALVLQDYVTSSAGAVLAARYPGVRLAVDRPGLFGFERRLMPDDGAGMRQGYDIIDLGLRVAAARGASSAALAEATVMLGVLATRAEWALIDRQRAALPDAPPPAAIANVSELVRSAEAAGVEMRMLDGSADGVRAIGALAVDDGIKAELATALGNGAILVAPASGIPSGDKSLYGWWQYDVATSQLVGRVPGGYGQGMFEYEWYVGKYLSADVSAIVGLSTTFLCMLGVDHPDNWSKVSARRKLSCLVVGIAAGVGTYGYWAHGALVSGMAGTIGVIAAVIAAIAD